MFRLRYLLLPVLLAYLATGIAQVRPEERAVVRRFGKVVARPGPGLWIGLPWGMDRVDRVPVRTVRQLRVGYVTGTTEDFPETPNGQLLTGDQNLVNMTLIVEYAIDESDSGLDAYIRHRNLVDRVLDWEAEATAREWIASQSVDVVLLTGHAAIPAWMMTRLPARLAGMNLGIVVQRVSVDLLAAPDRVSNISVRDSFEAVNQAQTNIVTREFQARQEAAQRLRDARAKETRLLAEGEAAAAAAITQATAEATVFTHRLEQYRRLQQNNPEILAAIWWDEMSKLLLNLKARGRIDLLDHHLGKDGLDLTQFVQPKK